MTHYNKKMWTLGGCLADHRKVFSSLPSIMGAYVGKHAVDPELNESVMVTVNSVNSCPYCEGLHGQLARMAGVENQEELMKAANVEECRALVDDPAITYARVFAENDGRGNLEEEGFQSLSQKTSAGFANSVRALCWFLLWGSIGGNTINGFLARLRGQGKPGSSALFELLFFLYYGPLFAVIAVVNMLLKVFPKVPKWFSAGFGALLTIIAGTWILLPGILSLVVPASPKILQLD